MIIKLSPYSEVHPLPISREVHKNGDVLTVNGGVFDFSPLPEGATLPASATNSRYFAGMIERIGGALHVTLTLPHGPNPSPAVAFPEPITVTDDGPIALPFDPEPELEVAE